MVLPWWTADGIAAGDFTLPLGRLQETALAPVSGGCSSSGHAPRRGRQCPTKLEQPTGPPPRFALGDGAVTGSANLRFGHDLRRTGLRAMRHCRARWALAVRPPSTGSGCDIIRRRHRRLTGPGFTDCSTKGSASTPSSNVRTSAERRSDASPPDDPPSSPVVRPSPAGTRVLGPLVQTGVNPRVAGVSHLNHRFDEPSIRAAGCFTEHLSR